MLRAAALLVALGSYCLFSNASRLPPRAASKYLEEPVPAEPGSNSCTGLHLFRLGSWQAWRFPSRQNNLISFQGNKDNWKGRGCGGLARTWLSPPKTGPNGSRELDGLPKSVLSSLPVVALLRDLHYMSLLSLLMLLVNENSGRFYGLCDTV